MSIIDRINARLLRKTGAGRPSLAIDADTLILTRGQTTTRLALADVTGAVAFHRDTYIGSVIVLALLFKDGRRIEADEESAAWPPLLAALDRLGFLALPSARWTTEMIARDTSSPPLVLLDASGG